MLLSFHKLHHLINQGVIKADPSLVNGASIDLTLGAEIQVCIDSDDQRTWSIVDLAAKENISTETIVMGEDGYVLEPGECVLAHSNEVFNLPNTIAAEYKLKSSMARNFLNHMLAGWCDPGWHGSQLTLEFHNCSNQQLRIRPGMKCGQVVFWECEDVGEGSYAIHGQYNGQEGAVASKGVR